MYSVGIDVGGTFLKGAILGPDGPVGGVRRLPTPPFLDMDGCKREIDPVALSGLVDALLGSLLETHGQLPVERILVTGQMAGLAFVDPSGRALAPLVTWQDRRVTSTENVARRLSRRQLADLGEELRPGLPLVTLTELRPPEGGSVTSLIAFVAGGICGAPNRKVHVSDAASWGLLDVARSRWNPAALEVAGLAETMLPEPTWQLQGIGVDRRLGLPVHCAIGDHQAALLGAGLRRGVVSVNLATGCQVSILTPGPKSSAQVRPFFDGTYLATITHLPAGRLLTEAVVAAEGSAGPDDWRRVAENPSAGVASAIESIVSGIAGAVDRLGARGLPVLLSGGLAQRFQPVRERIEAALDVPAQVYPGDDAALAGLALLARDVA